MTAMYFPAPDQDLESAIVRAKAIPHDMGAKLFYNGRALAWFKGFRRGWALVGSVVKGRQP